MIDIALYSNNYTNNLNEISFYNKAISLESHSNKYYNSKFNLRNIPIMPIALLNISESEVISTYISGYEYILLHDYDITDTDVFFDSKLYALKEHNLSLSYLVSFRYSWKNILIKMINR